MKSTLDATANIAMIVACCLVSLVAVQRLRNDRSAAESPLLVEDIEKQQLELTFDDGSAEGRADAPLVLVEFGDFQCTFCAQFNRDTYPAIEREYVKSGLVRHVFKHMPLANHALAFDAARAAECAGEQDAYWSMHSQLFTNQSKMAPSDLIDHAAAAGLDNSRFAACMKEETTARAVQADQADALRLQVSATPTFFVGRVSRAGHAKLIRRLRGAQPYSAFKGVLDELGNKQNSKSATEWFPLLRLASLTSPQNQANQACDASSCQLKDTETEHNTRIRQPRTLAASHAE